MADMIVVGAFTLVGIFVGGFCAILGMVAGGSTRKDDK